MPQEAEVASVPVDEEAAEAVDSPEVEAVALLPGEEVAREVDFPVAVADMFNHAAKSVCVNYRRLGSFLWYHRCQEAAQDLN